MKRITRLCLIFAIALCAWASRGQAGPAEPAAPPSSASDALGSLLGEGSSLEAEGEFTITQGPDGQLDSFRATKNVCLETKENSLWCDELVYDKAASKIVATAESGKRVNVLMLTAGISPTKTAQSAQSATRATCGRYEYFVDERRHVLTNSPTIFQKDKDGKEAAISGTIIVLAQDKNGGWQMNVKGNSRIGPPESEAVKRAREKSGALKRPGFSIDTAKPATPRTATAAPKNVKIDEGNVAKIQPIKSSRAIKLEEGA